MCQRNCCGTVIAVRFTVVGLALIIPVSVALCLGRTVLSNAWTTALRLRSGRSVSTHCCLQKPSFPRSCRRITSTVNFCKSASNSGLLPTPAPSTLRCLVSTGIAIEGRLGDAGELSILDQRHALVLLKVPGPVLVSQSATAFARRSRGSPLPQFVRSSVVPNILAAERLPITGVGAGGRTGIVSAGSTLARFFMSGVPSSSPCCSPQARIDWTATLLRRNKSRRPPDRRWLRLCLEEGRGGCALRSDPGLLDMVRPLLWLSLQHG